VILAAFHALALVFWRKFLNPQWNRAKLALKRCAFLLMEVKDQHLISVSSPPAMERLLSE
jgi:hypothetical protein